MYSVQLCRGKKLVKQNVVANRCVGKSSGRCQLLMNIWYERTELDQG